MIFTKDNNQGQGLLETVIAIGIIVTGVVGTMNLTISNQTSSSDAQDRLIAVNLAREGVEVIRNIRDTNWLSCEIASCNDWDEYLTSGTITIGTLLFDPDTNTWIMDFTADSIDHNNARVWRRNAGDYIGAMFQSDEAVPSNAALTGYNRIIELHSICDDKTITSSCGAKEKIGIRVQSTVKWENRGKPLELTAEERLFNWR